MGRITLVVLSIILGAVASSAAMADHRHFGHEHEAHFGVYLGAPWPWYWNYPAPYPYYPNYPYYPPVVAAPATPPVYMEQGQQQPAPPQKYYWYYCSNPQGYYPYVRQCQTDWQEVSPTPPNIPSTPPTTH